MLKPRAVVFDLGKVLLYFDYKIAVKRLLSRSPATIDQINLIINASPLLLRYENGDIGSHDFFLQVKTESGFLGDFEEFKELFGDIFTPIDSMVFLHSELKNKGIPTYIFSNTNELQIQFIRRKFPFFANFTGYILSFEHRAMKPQPALYEVVEKTSGCRGAEILYIDDRPENIEAGVKRGWHGIVHTSYAQTNSRIEELGLL